MAEQWAVYWAVLMVAKMADEKAASMAAQTAAYWVEPMVAKWAA